MEDFNRHFDIDQMLYDDAVWLSKQTVLPKNQFLELAKKIDLRQQDWDTFWKKVRTITGQRKSKELPIECVILGKEWKLDKDEFEYVTQWLGQPIEEVSNCCGADVYPHNPNDHTSRCRDCKEGCGIVYIF